MLISETDNEHYLLSGDLIIGSYFPEAPVWATYPDSDLLEIHTDSSMAIGYMLRPEHLSVFIKDMLEIVEMPTFPATIDSDNKDFDFLLRWWERSRENAEACLNVLGVAHVTQLALADVIKIY